MILGSSLDDFLHAKSAPKISLFQVRWFLFSLLQMQESKRMRHSCAFNVLRSRVDETDNAFVSDYQCNWEIYGWLPQCNRIGFSSNTAGCHVCRLMWMLRRFCTKRRIGNNARSAPPALHTKWDTPKCRIASLKHWDQSNPDRRVVCALAFVASRPKTSPGADASRGAMSFEIIALSAWILRVLNVF